MKLLIFTYAPAGLGHLRVTDALVEARPKDSTYVLLGSLDNFITWIHRYTSINPLGKLIFLAAQYGIFEDIFTIVYRWFLRVSSGGIYSQLKSLVEKNSQVDEVWVIATHFGMAHQIGAIKDKLQKTTGKKIKLIVQVTDDTSQHIWCVPGADVTFLPSKYVQVEFEKYASQHNIKFVSEVIPYPLSQPLIKKLPKGRFSRQKTFSEKTGKIRVAIPISGAAVGLKYFVDLIKYLSDLSDRFEFYVVVKKTPFTQMFIRDVKKIDNVKLMVGKNDIQMIELYELLYENNLIHIEITKPSEQSFKSILYPTSVGGSILLFTTPVGRQEKDNISFMMRHELMPVPGLNNNPRGISIPTDPKEAAELVVHLVNSGVFGRMSSPDFKFSKSSLKSGEIGPEGSRLFWKKLEKRLGK